MSTKKLNNQIIDDRLSSRNIMRMDNYVNAKTKIRFRCLKSDCNFIWITVPDAISSGHGCPKCAGVLKLTNEIVDEKLVGKNIKRIDNYINSKNPIKFECLICYYIWKTGTNNILLGETGCPSCSKKAKLNNEIIDQRLKISNRKINRIGNYINCDTAIHFQCSACEYIWKAAPNDVINDGTGCPKCAGSLLLTNEIVDQRLINRTVKRIDDYVMNSKSINFQCIECKYIWPAIPANVLNGTGCPNCKFGKNETLVYKTLISYGINVERQKSIKKIMPNEGRRIIADFYIDRTIIEYNGRQHYQAVCFGDISQVRAEANFIKQQERDLYLQRICDENNIKLIWIDGRKYTNSKLKKYIEEKIVPMLKICTP